MTARDCADDRGRADVADTRSDRSPGCASGGAGHAPARSLGPGRALALVGGVEPWPPSAERRRRSGTMGDVGAGRRRPSPRSRPERRSRRGPRRTPPDARSRPCRRVRSSASRPAPWRDTPCDRARCVARRSHDRRRRTSSGCCPRACRASPSRSPIGWTPTPRRSGDGHRRRRPGGLSARSDATTGRADRLGRS